MQTLSARIYSAWRSHRQASIDLGSTAVLTDNIASNFIAPANVADVKVYTADYDGNSKTFGDWEDFPGDVKISGNAVTVTGFNYSSKLRIRNPTSPAQLRLRKETHCRDSRSPDRLH